RRQALPILGACVATASGKPPLLALSRAGCQSKNCRSERRGFLHGDAVMAMRVGANAPAWRADAPRRVTCVAHRVELQEKYRTIHRFDFHYDRFRSTLRLCETLA